LADDGLVSIDDLPSEIRQSEAAEDGCPFRLPAGGVAWEQVEAGLLRQALDRSRGNRAAAARLLGLGYKAFLYRLEKYGMEEESENVAESPEMGS
jgi:transcriptional regulator of acetoin/glycerol metabolism